MLAARYVFLSLVLMAGAFAGPANPGDVDDSGLVDVLDIIAALQDKAGTYNTRSDSNNDGQINVFDLVLIARYYGTNYGQGVQPFYAWDPNDYTATQALIAANTNPSTLGTVQLVTGQTLHDGSTGNVMRAILPGDGTEGNTNYDLSMPGAGSSTKEVWIEFYTRFNNSWCCTSDDKTFFFSTGVSGRWELHYGGGGGRSFGGPGFSPQDLFIVSENDRLPIEQVWDGQWHRHRIHARGESTPGACDGIFEWWFDNISLVTLQQDALYGRTADGVCTGQSGDYFTSLRLGGNADPAGSGARDWGTLRVYDQDPGWTGQPACTPMTCQATGATCGSISDGCGGTLQCGACTGTNVCQANQCVQPAQICQSSSGTCYYASNKTTSGSGTFANPWGIPDLPAPNLQFCALSSVAMQALQPGDTLYFRGGRYEFPTCTDGSAWATPYIRSGTEGQPGMPITIRSYPGETVVLKRISGGQPIFGTDVNGQDYLRFIGLATEDSGVRLFGSDVELAYNHIDGLVSSSGDNNPALAPHQLIDSTIHHNVITGSRGPSVNSACIQLYYGTRISIHDNHIYNCTAGIFDKQAGLNNSYYRNYLHDNQQHFEGNNQGLSATYYLYDNVLIGGGWDLHYLNHDTEVHDNLILGNYLAGSWAGDVWNVSTWNNVVLGTGTIEGFENSRAFLNQQPLRYTGYNTYNRTATFSFGEYIGGPTTYTLNQMQAQGYELNSKENVAAPYDASWNINPTLAGTGRFSDDPGPDDVAAIMDVSRYGPANSGSYS